MQIQLISYIVFIMPPRVGVLSDDALLTFVCRVHRA